MCWSICDLTPRSTNKQTRGEGYTYCRQPGIMSVPTHWPSPRVPSALVAVAGTEILSGSSSVCFRAGNPEEAEVFYFQPSVLHSHNIPMWPHGISLHTVAFVRCFYHAAFPPPHRYSCPLSHILSSPRCTCGPIFFFSCFIFPQAPIDITPHGSRSILTSYGKVFSLIYSDWYRITYYIKKRRLVHKRGGKHHM